MNIDETVKSLYAGDEYISKHPSLFEEDAAWKLRTILPVVAQWREGLGGEQSEVSVLDVGGGAGLLLKGVAEYMRGEWHLAVDKYALDLSPGMLERQRAVNPDLVQAWQEDIGRTSLGDKAMALTLLIDVLEHVPNVAGVLREVGRISEYVLLKAPLEDTLAIRWTNVLNGGRTRELLARELGHIQWFTAGGLKGAITEELGEIVHFSFTNVYAFQARSPSYRQRVGFAERFLNGVCGGVARICPALAARIYTDFALVLVKCYK